MNANLRPIGVAIGLSVVLSVVYLASLPDAIYVASDGGESVAGQLGKAPYLQSDGAFIVDQFRLGGSFTHNDHVLYHVLARKLHKWVFPNEITVHLALSGLAGGFGIGVLMLAGYQLSARLLPSVLAALLIAGSASYWYFAASIDTYVPALLFCNLSIAVALLCLDLQRIWCYVALGCVAGIAFLWRTDAVLLAPLVLTVLGAPRGRLSRVAACGLSAMAVGGVGYILLANHEYGIALKDVWAWATGSLNRPPARTGVWGTRANLNTSSFGITASNQLVYAVILPGLARTRELAGAISWSPSGIAAVLVYALFGAGALVQMARRTVRPGSSRLRILLVLGITSVVLRLVFYTWWDPHDPFLFAASNLPYIWLFSMLPFDQTQLPRTEVDSVSVQRLVLILLALLVPLVWWHNVNELVLPIWRMIDPR